jgi:RNA polymerase sigma factor (sigma-70 family)
VSPGVFGKPTCGGRGTGLDGWRTTRIPHDAVGNGGHCLRGGRYRSPGGPGRALSCLCYPVYAFIRRRSYGRQDAQDLTQDFFVYLLEKSALGRADPQRGRFRSFLLGTLDHFLAHAAERARTLKRGGDCQFVYLDDDTAENHYQLAARMTAEKIFEARWAAALIEAALVRLRVEFQGAGKGQLFDAIQGFLLSGEDASYQQVADGLGLSLGAIKTAIHRIRSRYRALLREEVARTVATPAEVEDELRCLRAALRG